MPELTQKQAASREKTLLTALLLSLPGPFITGYAAATSLSTTQIADFLRRSIELAALFISWWVFRQLQKNKTSGAAGQARLERIAGSGVAAAMGWSGLVMLGIAWSRLFVSAPNGNVTVGLVIAVLGLLTNGWFWRRYTTMTREHYSPVIAVQQKLYRAKASVDFCVVSALTAVAIAPTHPATRFVDILGSAVVASYLLWTGLRMAQPYFGDIRRRLPHFGGKEVKPPS